MTHVAIVHDYLTQRGGAERVVLSMAKAFPGAVVHTSLYEPGATFPEFADLDVRPMPINRLRALRKDHRRGLPLYPMAFSAERIDADVVLCSSSGFAHGVRTDGVKVVYCYTPPRWLYDQAATYVDQWPAPVALAVRALGPGLRAWDRRAAASARCYLTSSTTVRERIRAAYGIDSHLVPPGSRVDVDGPRSPVPDLSAGFALCVSRLLSYKHVEAVAEAFRSMPDMTLVVVGDGPAAASVRRAAGPNVRVLARVSDAELRWLYQHSSMLVAASFEDFGLTPIEAAAWGRPTAALRAGGYLDTVRDGVTGAFFDEASPAAIADAVATLRDLNLPSEPIVRHAEHYSEDAFIDRLRSAVETCAGTETSSARPLTDGSAE